LSNPEETPKWNTTSLWGVLLVFLVVGTLGAATFAYGVLGLLSGDLLYAGAIAIGAVVAGFSFLFLAGILYRVDRYRGANLRRVEFFE
jgi:amino acid transporter